MKTLFSFLVVLAALPIATARAADRNLAEAAEGEKLYPAKCGACHSLASNRVGPMHRGVFGRKAGSVEGYRYSQAVASSDIVWDADTLDRWLADPGAVIPGQRMGFRLGSDDQRRAIIAYLRRESQR